MAIIIIVPLTCCWLLLANLFVYSKNDRKKLIISPLARLRIIRTCIFTFYRRSWVNPLRKWVILFIVGNRQKDLNSLLLVSLTLQGFTMGWLIPKGCQHCKFCHQDTLIAWRSYLWRIWTRMSMQCRWFLYTSCTQEVDSQCSTMCWLEECSSTMGLRQDHWPVTCTVGEEGRMQLSRSMKLGLSRRAVNFQSGTKNVNTRLRPVCNDCRLLTGQYTTTIKHRMCIPSSYVEGYFKWSPPPAMGRGCVMLFLEMIGIALLGFTEKLTLFKETREILTSYNGQFMRFSVSIAH